MREKGGSAHRTFDILPRHPVPNCFHWRMWKGFSPRTKLIKRMVMEWLQSVWRLTSCFQRARTWRWRRNACWRRVSWTRSRDVATPNCRQNFCPITFLNFPKDCLSFYFLLQIPTSWSFSPSQIDNCDMSADSFSCVSCCTGDGCNAASAPRYSDRNLAPFDWGYPQMCLMIEARKV